MEQMAEKLISEADLLKALGLKKSELDRLRREKGFPYIKFSQRSRAYFLSDVMEWARKNRVTPEMG
jgi:predicted DNA-binding transcriptional regulator AlpA